jgi:dTMP kinase
MDDHDIAILEQFVLQGLMPDLTVLLDAPPDVSAARRLARGISDRFEAEEAAFFARVRQKYRERAVLEPGRVALVDASGSLEEVQATLVSILKKYFNNS